MEWGQVKPRGKIGLGALAGGLAFFALTLFFVLTGLNEAESSVRANGLRGAEEAVQRAAVTCYALEGAYPESYGYLKEHYAVNVNEKSYLVSYTIFASNLMPDITVTER